MSLTSKQLTRLGELLDASLPLSLDERRAWLASLPAEDEPLRQTLSEALLSDDPAPRSRNIRSHILGPDDSGIGPSCGRRGSRNDSIPHRARWRCQTADSGTCARM